MNQLPKSVGAGNPHATFCGNRGRATASGDPVGVGRASEAPPDERGGNRYARPKATRVTLRLYQSFAFVDRPSSGRSAPKAVIPWCAGRPVKSPFCAALWGKPHSRPTYSVWAEAGFPAFTLYACKSMLRFSFTRSSITSERTSLLFFFGKVLRYSMIACHSLTSIEELAPAPRTA